MFLTPFPAPNLSPNFPQPNIAPPPISLVLSLSLSPCQMRPLPPRMLRMFRDACVLREVRRHDAPGPRVRGGCVRVHLSCPRFRCLQVEEV